MDLPNTRAVHEDGWAPVETGDRNYHRLWLVYKLRRLTALALLFGWVPVTYALFYYSRHYWHTPFLSLSAILVWLVAGVSAVWWQGEFRCPRCRRRYGALGNRKGDTNYTRGLFDTICANCKLRKFENG